MLGLTPQNNLTNLSDTARCLPSSGQETVPSVWYRVAHDGGLDLRTGPSVTLPRTGASLSFNAIFAVSEEIRAADGRVYLRLADGRGWAFDNSVLMPHSPSVVKGNWLPVGACIAHMSPVSQTLSFGDLMGEVPAPEAMKKRRRRKRGGVKRNKNKRKAMALAQESCCDSEADAETEVPSSASDAGMTEEEETASEQDVFADEMPAEIVVTV